MISLIVNEVIKKIAGDASEKALKHAFEIEKDELRDKLRNLPELFETHLIELINWSSKIPFLSFRHKDIESSTVELAISPSVSKLNDENSALISENELLSANENIVLLGLPGAGKTTTLQRIILKYFVDGFENCSYNFPILVRFRNLEGWPTLSTSILDLLGISYASKVVDKKLQIYKLFVGETLIDIFLPKLLNATNALLILDGLDEVPSDQQVKYQREIENLALRLNSGKIIYTVRSSTLSVIETRFVHYQINPLSDIQVQAIAKRWIKDSTSFYNLLLARPYADLANRPIFLTLLMILYLNSHDLPPQASEVYKDFTYFIVKEWDEDRDIPRRSKYANFNSRKKIKFLSELSYQLTYKIKSKEFSTNTLNMVYSNIYKKYQLPRAEANQVISEIVSHTGIISEGSGTKTFQFSHLSIQEYLCAEHLVTLPISEKTVEYFYEYPDPLAIAACLSGESGLWIARLLMDKTYNIRHKMKRLGPDAYKKSFFTFMSRLLWEFPAFTESRELGCAILTILFDFFIDDPDYFNLVLKMLKLPSVLFSLNMALEEYTVKKRAQNGIYLEIRKQSTALSKFYDIPKSGILPLLIFTQGKFIFSDDNNRPILFERLEA